VAAGSHDSFQTTFVVLEVPGEFVELKYAELKLPSALNGTSLCGFHDQPNCSCVPPTDVTYGLELGHSAVGKGKMRVSFCCFDTFAVPKSPEAPKNESPFAIPFWKTWSKRAVCTAAAPPKVCSAAARLIEKTVPAG
jgi:hypothetical protein